MAEGIEEEAHGETEEGEGGEAKPARPGCLRRILTLVLRLVLLLLFLVVLLVGALWALLRTESAARFALDKAMPIVEDLLPGRVRFSSFSGALGTRFSLHDVVIEDEQGVEFITATEIALGWDVMDLLFGELQASSVELVDPRFVLRQREDGTLNVVTAFVKPGPPREKDPDAPPAQLPFDIVVQRVVLTNGSFVFERPDGSALVDVNEISLDAAYSLRDWVHDAAITEVGAKLDAPVTVSHTSLLGSARLDEDLVLTMDGIQAFWNDAKVFASGTLGPVTDLHPDLRAVLENVDLDAVRREFAPKAPIRGVVGGDITWGGTLSDMTFDGVITTAGGGELTLTGGQLGLHEQLSYKADLGLSKLALSELLDVPQLPPALTGTLSVDASGTTPESLRGSVQSSLAPMLYQGLRIGPIRLDASLDDEGVLIRDLRAGLAGGTPTVRGRVDLAGSCFDLLVGGDIAALQTLGPLAKVPITSGAVALDATAVGCWGKESALLDMVSAGKANLSNLRLTPGKVWVDKGTVGWDLTIRLPKAAEGAKGSQIPLLTGPVQVDLGQVEALDQVLHTALVEGALAGSAFGFNGRFTSGPDLGLEAVGKVDWGKLPTVTLYGERVAAWYRDLRLDTTQAFELRIREGAIEASGVVAKTEQKGGVILQGTLDPKGEANALLRVLTFDLVQTDAFLPEGGELRGKLEDLTINLKGQLAAPELSVRARLRNFATRGRGPMDLDLDLAYKDGVLSGSLALLRLLELDIGRFPLAFRLDGEGGLPAYIPPDEEMKAELRLTEGSLARFEAPLGLRLPSSYVGGKVRGQINLSGKTNNPLATGSALLRDLVVDLARLEARATGLNEAPAEQTSDSREVSVRASYELRDGTVALRDTQVRTNAEGTVLELGASAEAAVGEYLMAIAGPRELRTKERPPLLDALEFTAILRRLPMTLVHIIAPAAKPLGGALTGSVSVTGELANPVVHSDLRLIGGRVGPRPLRTLSLSADVEKGLLNANLELVPDLLISDEEEPGQSLEAAEAKGAKKAKKKGKQAKPKSLAARRRAEELEEMRKLLASNPDAGRLSIAATAPLPLALDGSRTAAEMFGQPGLKGSIASEGFPVGLLLAFLPGAMEARGTLDLQGEVAGTLLDPKPDVRLGMQDGAFQYARTAVSYEDIDLDLRLSAEALEVNEISLRTLPLIRNPLDVVFKPNVSQRRTTDKKDLVVRGAAKLDGWSLGQVSLNVEAWRLWAMYTEEVKAQLTADLSARGTWPDIKVTGTVDVDDVGIELGQDDTSRKVLPMDLPENLVVHRGKELSGKKLRLAGAPIVAEVKEPGLLDLLDADVLVRLGNKVRLKLALGLASGRDDALRILNTFGSIEPDVNLGGEVRVRVTDGSPRLVGTIEVTRDSTLVALTRKFDIEPGSEVVFVGELGDSALRVDAVYPSSYGEVRVKLRGQLSAPEIEFVSEELADQSDIMAVLLTGKPLSEQTTGEGASVGKQIGSLLGGFTTKLAGRATPLDKLEIDLGDDFASGSVEAGKALTPELFLVTRFRWGVEDVLENRVEAELQYRPRGLRRFSIEARIGDRLAGGAEIVWRVLFKPGEKKAAKEAEAQRRTIQPAQKQEKE